MRRLLCLFTIITLTHVPRLLSGQFVTPVPEPLPEAAVRKADLLAGFHRFVQRSAGDSLRDLIRREAAGDFRALLLSSLQTFCDSKKDPVACLQAFDGAVLGSMVGALSTSPPASRVTWLPLRVPGFQSRSDLVEYVEMSGGRVGLNVFSSFAANVSESEALVLTELVSGLAGRAMFAANYAAVVVKDTTADLVAREEVESDRATVLRMVNNGGTLTGRFQFPFYARSGTTLQSGNSLYTNLGLVGPLGITSEVRFAGAVTLESMNAVSIRDHGPDGSLLADLLIGLRAGIAFSERPFVASSEARTLRYLQLAVGLRQNRSLSLATLVTWVDNPVLGNLLPKLVVNFTGMR